MIFYYPLAKVFKLLIGLIIMSNFNKDIFIGLMFITGIWSFISGQFIISTVLFAAAAIYSNIVIRAKLN
jgi:membrane protein implicated in regulation of membrane protease activity